MKLPVLLVVMHGIADLAMHVNVAKAVEDLDDLAMPLTSEQVWRKIREARRK